MEHEFRRMLINMSSRGSYSIERFGSTSTIKVVLANVLEKCLEDFSAIQDKQLCPESQMLTILGTNYVSVRLVSFNPSPPVETNAGILCQKVELVFNGVAQSEPVKVRPTIETSLYVYTELLPSCHDYCSEEDVPGALRISVHQSLEGAKEKHPAIFTRRGESFRAFWEALTKRTWQVYVEERTAAAEKTFPKNEVEYGTEQIEEIDAEMIEGASRVSLFVQANLNGTGNVSVLAYPDLGAAIAEHPANKCFLAKPNDQWIHVNSKKEVFEIPSAKGSDGNVYSFILNAEFGKTYDLPPLR